MSRKEQYDSIRGVVESVESITGQPAVYHDLHDRPYLANAAVCDVCSYCLKHPVASTFCRYACHSAAMQAFTSGEPHYQRCWAGLLFVTVPVAPKGECLGGIACGGFLATGEEQGFRENLVSWLSALPDVDPDPFLQHAGGLRNISANALRGLGFFLLEATCSSGLNVADFIRRQHDKYQQQREIAEAYADIRQFDVEPSDIAGDTYQLATYLLQNDREGAMRFVSRYLAKLLRVSNWNLTKLRAHVRVLLAVMTSQDVLGGMEWAAAVGREMRHLTRIEQAGDTETICAEVADMVLEHFRGLEQDAHPSGSLADRVTGWLQRNFRGPAGIEQASRAVGASVSTIAHGLPRETGKTFSRLRREIRIAEAKKLLAASSMEISEIADMCGFADQSHFTRVFKSSINLTPGQFRRMLTVTKECI